MYICYGFFLVNFVLTSLDKFDLNSFHQSFSRFLTWEEKKSKFENFRLLLKFDFCIYFFYILYNYVWSTKYKTLDHSFKYMVFTLKVGLNSEGYNWNFIFILYCLSEKQIKRVINLKRKKDITHLYM